VNTFRTTPILALFFSAFAALPQSASQVTRPRPSVEQRQSFQKRMWVIHLARAGCFEAHFPEERWVEKQCLPDDTPRAG
jgi:hypothetical protein